MGVTPYLLNPTYDYVLVNKFSLIEESVLERVLLALLFFTYISLFLLLIPNQYLPLCLQCSLAYSFLVFWFICLNRILGVRNTKKQKKNFLIGMLKLLRHWKMVQLLLKRGMMKIKNWGWN